jgi:prepilin-type processing-associated H-X9-DG protein
LCIGQAYDTAVQMGVGTVDSVAQAAGRLVGYPRDGTDERTFLEAYLNARDGMADQFGGAYIYTKYRQRSYRHALSNNYLWFDGSSGLSVLTNDGQERWFTC